MCKEGGILTATVFIISDMFFAKMQTLTHTKQVSSARRPTGKHGFTNWFKRIYLSAFATSFRERGSTFAVRLFSRFFSRFPWKFKQKKIKREISGGSKHFSSSVRIDICMRNGAVPTLSTKKVLLGENLTQNVVLFHVISSHTSDVRRCQAFRFIASLDMDSFLNRQSFHFV